VKESVLSERGMRVHTTWKQIQRTKERERERERERKRERERERERKRERAKDGQKERDRDGETERQDIKRETGGCLQRWCMSRSGRMRAHKS